MDRKNIVILFGGQSSEHEVSCSSANMLLNNINKEKYNILLVFILILFTACGWDNNGKTALDFARKNGRGEIVEYLEKLSENNL